MDAPHIGDTAGGRIHMIGIGGSSMSGLCEMLLSRGYTVTGSDRAGGHAAERLRARGVTVYPSHEAQNVRGADIIVYSAAIGEDNPERAEGKRLRIPEMERAVLLGQLMEGAGEAVCVSGAHGKTTASSMIAQVLLDAGLDPSVHIGGRLDALGGGSRVGSGKAFVAEACEFHSSFLYMKPTVAVVLNIDADHLDYYGTIENVEKAFDQFLHLLPEDGLAIGNRDNARTMRVFENLNRQKRTFGLTKAADYWPDHLTYDEEGCAAFSAMRGDVKLCDIRLRVAGEFNALNALAALAVAERLAVPFDQAAAALHAFSGVHRRLETTGYINGARLVHDYGHNPAEMRAALAVCKKWTKGRLIAVMQPHTYSRVKTLFSDYLDCTKDADITLVTDICAAREKDPGDISSGMLVDGMRRNGIFAEWTPSFDDTEKKLLEIMRPGDLALTMGCGDINLLNEQMHRHESERSK